jgi:hypothetical protein
MDGCCGWTSVYTKQASASSVILGSSHLIWLNVWLITLGKHHLEGTNMVKESTRIKIYVFKINGKVKPSLAHLMIRCYLNDADI